jgi:hypothetical protein
VTGTLTRPGTRFAAYSLYCTFSSLPVSVIP